MSDENNPEETGRVSEMELVVMGDLSEDDVTPCPECDFEHGEPQNGTIACMNEGCDVGDYLPDGTVIWRV
jgi:hypothetical protein